MFKKKLASYIIAFVLCVCFCSSDAWDLMQHCIPPLLISWQKLISPEDNDMQTSCFGYRFRRGDFQSKDPGVIPNMFFSHSQDASSCQRSLWVCTAWHKIIPQYWRKDPFVQLESDWRMINQTPDQIWVEICIHFANISTRKYSSSQALQNYKSLIEIGSEYLKWRTLANILRHFENAKQFLATVQICETLF